MNIMLFAMGAGVIDPSPRTNSCQWFRSGHVSEWSNNNDMAIAEHRWMLLRFKCSGRLIAAVRVVRSSDQEVTPSFCRYRSNNAPSSTEDY